MGKYIKILLYMRAKKREIEFVTNCNTGALLCTIHQQLCSFRRVTREIHSERCTVLDGDVKQESIYR